MIPMPDSAEIPLKKGEELVVSRASMTNRIRDIGLLLVAAGLAAMIFLWMNTESKQQRALAELAAESKEAIDKANKNMDAMQAELERVRKVAVAADAVKNEIRGEFKATREMMFKAWQHHAKELESVKKAIERIEKASPKKME